MSGNNFMGAGTGILAGIVIGMADVGRDWNRRSRHAERRADNAQATADQALLELHLLADSGDLVRIGQDQFSDMALGIAFPGQSATISPSPLASEPQILPRPVLTEDWARDFTQWPGRVNDYNARGNLVNPQLARQGQNFLTGLALGFSEVRAFLAGLPQFGEGGDAPAVAGQYYRVAKGLAHTLRNLITSVAPDGLSQAAFDAAWARFLGVPVTPSASGLTIQRIDSFQVSGPVATNSTVETELGRLTIPANTLGKAGDRLIAEFAFAILGQHSTDTNTFQVRLDSLSGTVLAQSAAINSASVRGMVRLAPMFRTSPNNQLALMGELAVGTVISSPSVATVPFDPTVPHVLILTDTQSVADPANQAQATFGDLTLQRAS